MPENDNETRDNVSESRDSGGSSADSFRSEISNDPSANSRIDEMMNSRGGLPGQFNNDFRIETGSQIPELPGQDPNIREGSLARNENPEGTQDSSKERNGQVERNPYMEQNKNEYKDRGENNTKEGQTERNPEPDKPQNKEKATDANSKLDEQAYLNDAMPVGGKGKPSGQSNDGVWRPTPQEPDQYPTSSEAREPDNGPPKNPQEQFQVPIADDKAHIDKNSANQIWRPQHPQEAPLEGERIGPADSGANDRTSKSGTVQAQGAEASPRRADTLGGKTASERRIPDDVVYGKPAANRVK